MSESSKQGYAHVVELIKNNNQRQLKQEIPNLIEHVSRSVLNNISGFAFNEVRDIAVSKYARIHVQIVNDNIRDNRTLLNYYYTAVYRECITISRGKTRDRGEARNPYSMGTDEYIVPTVHEDDNDIWEKMEKIGTYQELYEEIGKLTDTHKDVIHMCLQYPEISSKDGAELLGIGDVAFRQRKYRALTQLKQGLTN